MVSIDHFRREMRRQFNYAVSKGQLNIIITCGELHRDSGGYYGSKHGLPECCEAMQDEIKIGDTVILSLSNGSGMTISYSLPRKLT
jgi:hypothetical protein